jgi:hypothetical protein
MQRFGLIAVLAVTQLLSWSVQPLYLCLGSDGSVDICLGPGHCDCEKSHACGTDECCDDDHDCCHEHQHGGAQLAGVQLTDNSGCDCTHIQISQPQGPTIVRKTVSADREDADFVTATAATLSIWKIPAAPRANSFAHSLLGGHSLPLAQLASVTLRC